jgi:DNA-binding XRE family transcriptional regulator
VSRRTNAHNVHSPSPTDVITPVADSDLDLLDTAVGAKIRSIREERGMSRERLAVNAGVSMSTIVKIETGRPALARTLHRIALGFGLDGLPDIWDGH